MIEVTHLLSDYLLYDPSKRVPEKLLGFEGIRTVLGFCAVNVRYCALRYTGSLRHNWRLVVAKTETQF